MAFNMVTRKYRLSFTEPQNGTAPQNKEIYSDYIAAKAPNPEEIIDEELETLSASDMIEKGTTVFHRDENGEPILMDYHIRGFMKSAMGALKNVPKTESSKIKAYKKKVDTGIFVFPRHIPIKDYGEITILERPLRAQTAQGERVSLARSEQIGAGAKIEIEIGFFEGSENWELIEEILDYGAFNGIGQWRNASYGRFTWEEIKE